MAPPVVDAEVAAARALKRRLLEEEDKPVFCDPCDDENYVDYVPKKVKKAKIKGKLDEQLKQERKEEEARIAAEVLAEKKRKGVTNSLLAVSQKLRAEEEANKEGREQA